MNKNITLLLAGLAVTLQTTGQTTGRAVPRPAAPGMDFHMPIKTHHAAPGAQKHVSKLSGKQALAPVPMKDVAGTTPYDTLLVTSYVTTRNGEETGRTTITYDEYGLRKTMLEYGRYGRLDKSYRYTYTIGAFNYWTSKFVELSEYFDEGVFKPYQKEVREIDGNKRLTRQTIYSRDWDGDDDAYKIYIEKDTKYDYAHPVKDYEGNISYGHAIEEIKDFGRNKVSYAWFEPAQEYVRTRVEYYGQCNLEASFGPDYITETSYNYEYDYVTDSYNKQWKESERTTYYAGGNTVGTKYISYDKNGQITDISGDKTTIEENTPSAGIRTETYYEVDRESGEFIPVRKTEKKGNTGSYTENYEMRTYEYIDGSWRLSGESKGENVGNNVFKVTNGSYTYYVHTDGNGSVDGYVQMKADGSYVVERSAYEEEPDGTYYSAQYYTTYDASGNVLREVKRTEENRNPLGHGTNDESYTYYIKSNGTWQLMNEYEEVLSQGGTTQRTKYGFTSEGYPSYIETYISTPSINKGEEFLNEQTKYIYTDNGYTVESYERYYTSYTQSHMWMSEKDEYLLLSDGTYRHTNYEYDEDHPTNIDYASREEEKDGIHRQYSYDKNTGFTLTYAYCDELRTVAEDGTETIISRRMSDDYTTVINEYKRENKQIRNGDEEINNHASYRWDEEGGKWIGESKEEYKAISLPAFYRHNADPIAQYSDEYLPMDEPDTIVRTIDLRARNGYRWDYETDTWVSEQSEDYSYNYEGENKLTYKTVSRDNDRLIEETTTLERDESHRIIQEKVTRNIQHFYGDDTETDLSSTTTSYTYNRDGYVETKTVVSESNQNETTTEVVRYEYTLHSVYPTRIETVTTDGHPAITVTDDAIRTADGAAIRLYDANGRLIATGKGSVQKPAAGLYIVRTSTGSAKITVK